MQVFLEKGIDITILLNYQTNSTCQIDMSDQII